MRILLLLGDTPSSLVARRHALWLARETNAALTGFAGVDAASLQVAMPGRIGSSAYSAELNNELQQEAGQLRQSLHDAFERECRDHGVTFEWLSYDGDVASALLLAAETRDLIVTGHDTASCGDSSDSVPEALSKLLSSAPRPVIICPDETVPNGEVLIAYDGSPVAMRTLQIFTLLGMAKGVHLHVTSIEQNQELATRRTSAAAIYLRSHGYEVETSAIASAVEPSEVLRIEVTNRKVGMLVIGAYGYRGLRSFLFGSTSQNLIENPPCMLFAYH
jgi:nucleotide-binding universal stress UspA family protein